MFNTDIFCNFTIKWWEESPLFNPAFAHSFIYVRQTCDDIWSCVVIVIDCCVFPFYPLSHGGVGGWASGSRNYFHVWLSGDDAEKFLQGGRMKAWPLYLQSWKQHRKRKAYVNDSKGKNVTTMCLKSFRFGRISSNLRNLPRLECYLTIPLWVPEGKKM